MDKLKDFFLGTIKEKELPKLIEKLKESYPNIKVIQASKDLSSDIFRRAVNEKEAAKYSGMWVAGGIVLMFVPGAQPIAALSAAVGGAGAWVFLKRELNWTKQVFKELGINGKVLALKLVYKKDTLKDIYILYTPRK